MSDLTDDAPVIARPSPKLRRISMKHLLAGAALTVLVGAASWYGRYYWEVGRFLEQTDDAYVQADTMIVAPRISGHIAEVLVADNQPVKAGQVLARIDDRDASTALAQASAARAESEANVANIAARLQLQQSTIRQAEAQLASAKAAQEFAAQDQKRYSDLARSGAGSLQHAQQTQSLLRQRVADLQNAEAALLSARQQVDVLTTSMEAARADVRHAQAVEQQAQLNLGYTTIRAPADGTIGARTLRVGQYVQPGTQLMAIVPLSSVYIVANYKETQLADVRAGQPVDVAIDGLPDAQVHGVVDSISPASGMQFALLPADNATGNFTKIVQRIPVKIRLTGDAGLIGLLRPGMSVEPTIDTRPGAVTSLASR